MQLTTDACGSSPALVESRVLPNKPWISLAEALSWIAFGDALSQDVLEAQVEGHPEPSTDNPESQIQSFFSSKDDEAPQVPGLGYFCDRQSGLSKLTDAWHQLRYEVERGRVKCRGRFTASYSFADAHLADVVDLTDALLATFSQFDVSTGGIRRQPGGSPDVLYRQHPCSLDREINALIGDVRATDGYLLVEVGRAGMNAFLAENEHIAILTPKRRRPGPAPDPDWPEAVAEVTRDCIEAGYRRPIRRGNKAAIITMLLNFLAKKDKHFSDDTAAKYADKVIDSLPDN